MLEKKVQWNLGKSYGLCSASNVIFRVNDKIKEFISVSYIFFSYICFCQRRTSWNSYWRLFSKGLQNHLENATDEVLSKVRGLQPETF